MSLPPTDGIPQPSLAALKRRVTAADASPQSFEALFPTLMRRMRQFGMVPAAQPATPASPATFTVRSGDTLARIAREVLGDMKRWPEIYALNRDKIQDPGTIYAGMVLRLPGPGVSVPAPPEPSQPTVSPEGWNVPPVGTNPSPETYDAMFNFFADQYGIPRAILKAIAYQESKWSQYNGQGQPTKGDNGNTVDWGTMQINDYWHPNAFPRAKTDVVFNIEYGAQYLARQYQRYGNWRDAIAAYNAGSVQRIGNGYKNQRYVDLVVGFLSRFGGAAV